MPKYTFKEFKSDQEVRWCPGCGDHGVLAALQRSLPDVTEALGYNKENYVVVSGIGCSSRLPYYMNTFGARTPICFTEGKGITLKDTEGREYKDFFAWIASWFK